MDWRDWLGGRQGVWALAAIFRGEKAFLPYQGGAYPYLSFSTFFAGALMDMDSIKNFDPEFKAAVLAVLPEAVNDFIRLIGFDATMALVMARGGTESSFPKNKDSKYFDDVAGVVGEDAATMLSIAYSGEEDMYIPMCSRAKALIRNHQIIADYDEMLRRGESVRSVSNNLAVKYQMSYRRIEGIVNKGF